jgi:hypothetical protein
VLTLSQSGTTVTGSGQIIGVVTGTISGTVTGNKLAFQYTLPQSCAGTLSGNATLSGAQLNGSFSGTSQCMGTVSASFQGVKAP